MDELKIKITKYLKSLAKNPAKLLGLLCKGFDKNCEEVSKDSKLSEKARNEGNKIFIQNNHNFRVHHKILHFYNESIAFAPNESEQLAIAYGNRSAILRHIRRYNESVTEIDKALKITKCAQLKVKLLCRKADCLTALGSAENRSCLEKAKFILSKLNESEEVKKNMNNLITQAQSIIDADDLDNPKKNLTRANLSKIVSEAENADIWSSVKIEYNEKHGRYLVAARDFKPGEIVLVEKPYVNELDETQRYMYCSHCWNYLWTVNPCKSCAWRLFCSEKCRDEAFSEYHDGECSTVRGMKEDSSLKSTHMIPFLIRVFFRMLKEAGSINQLREDLEFIDGCKDEHRRVFSSARDFKNYNVLYTQPIRRGRDILQMSIEVSVLCLLGIAKHSSIFSTRYDSSEIYELIKDDSAVFVGALLLQIYQIIIHRIITVFLPNPCKETDTGKDRIPLEFPLHQKQISSSLRSVGLLSIISCVPNIRTFIIKNNRHVTCSLSPIKKGSPLITATTGGIYTYTPKSERQAMHQMAHGRPCDCSACEEDWLEFLKDDGKFMDSIAAKSVIGNRLAAEKASIDEEFDAKFQRLNFPDAKLLSRARNLVAEAWEHFPMPSRMTVGAINSLVKLLRCLHAPQNREFLKDDSCRT